jgi:hypothetical protein
MGIPSTRNGRQTDSEKHSNTNLKTNTKHRKSTVKMEALSILLERMGQSTCGLINEEDDEE